MSAKGETPAPKFQAPPALTLVEQLATLPKFERDVATEDEERVGCICGLRSESKGGRTFRDRVTRLCVACWRCWVFSANRARDITPAR